MGNGGAGNWLRGRTCASRHLTLNYYQAWILWIAGLACVIIAGLACVIDVACFTLLTAKSNQLAPDLVVNR